MVRSVFRQILSQLNDMRPPGDRDLSPLGIGCLGVDARDVGRCVIRDRPHDRVARLRLYQGDLLA